MNDYPIVLAHGIARFDELRNFIIRNLQTFLTDLSIISDRTHYFRRIKTHLQKHDIQAFHANVSFASDVSVRGRELAQNILDIMEDGAYEKVHIIAHSMGGLDARYMLVHEGIEDRVASLTTIGTPHLGTSYADHAFEHGGEVVIKALMDIFGFELAGFLTLTPEARDGFNEAARNVEAKNNVAYHVYASSQERARLRGFLRHPWDVVQSVEGENDGLVSVSSQLWTAELTADDGTTKTIHQHQFPVSADHSNQIGWWDINELEGGRWWYPGALRQRRAYEGQIRHAYLEMARAVRSADPD